MKRISKSLRLSHIFAFVIAALFMAINVNAAETTTIKLTEERTEQVLVKKGENVILDLNGNNITVTNNHAIEVNEGGTLTIKGTGTVTASTANYGAIFNNGGTVEVNGGEYIATGWYAIKNLGIMTINDATVGGTLQKQNSSLVANGFYGYESNYPKEDYTGKVLLTINGGKFTHKNTTSTIKGDDWSKTVITGGEFISEQGFLIQATGTVEVSGGTFTGYSSVAILYGFNSPAYLGILNISGGNFEAKYIASAYNDGKLTITGGDFTKVTDGVISPEKQCNGAMCAYTATITGGSFNSNVTPEVPEGYQVLTLADKNVIDKTLELKVDTDTVYYVEKGKSVSLNYTANDTAKKYLEITSADKAIATVSDGMITGVKAGTTEITLDAPGLGGSVKVVVFEVVPEETTETESNNVSTESAVAISDNVSAIVSDVLAGKKEIKGIDTETSEKIAAAVKEGNVITTELENKEVKTDDLSKETTEKVEKVLNKDEKIAAAFDINVLIKQNNESIGKLTELDKKIVVIVDVPKELPAVKEGFSRTYYMIRVHDGVAERLETKLENGKLSFQTDKFSDYVLVYEDVANTELDDTPKTGDISYAAAIITISILGLGAVKVLKRN